MPHESETAGSKRATAAGGADLLGGLPDELLQELLSFLPSRDTVRTCVLARRWRNLWKSVPALRITLADTARYWGASALNKFFNYLLFYRNRSPLHEAEFNSFEGAGDFDEAVQYLELWVRYSLSCPVGKLCVTNNDEEELWFLPKGLITSEHLRKLQLSRVQSEHDLDFSSCVALQDLKMEYCSIYCNWVMSLSLKRLSIMVCVFPNNVRTKICAPNLISLLLVDCGGRTPLPEIMPLLVDAFVRLQHGDDWCQKGYETGDCGDESCRGRHDSNYGKSTSVLLQGLSSSTNLELTASPEQFIFRKDLMQCPIFSKLKTLLLNDWCVTANLGALICFLQHSPVLKKLILQFPKIHKNLVEMGASYDLKKQALVLKDLTVEVKCHEVYEHICKVLDVLGSCGLHPEKIKILKPPEQTGFQFIDTWPEGSFSFEQKTCLQR